MMTQIIDGYVRQPTQWAIPSPLIKINTITNQILNSPWLLLIHMYTECHQFTFAHRVNLA